MGQDTTRQPDLWTIRRVVAWITDDFRARELDTPRLDADLLVAEVLGLTRVQLFLDLDRPLAASELSSIRALVARRRMHEPIAYILGRREFYGRSFEVNSSVLIPRPDTETLVERALFHIDASAITGTFLDVGTGSGNLAVTLVSERPELSADAVDSSTAALAVAKTNAEAHGCSDRVRFLEGDLFSPVEDNTYDLIVSNPPYVADDADLPPDVAAFEPKEALFGGGGAGGDGGLTIIGRLLSAAPAFLRPKGLLLVEFGWDQAEEIRARVEQVDGLEFVEIQLDLGGRPRVLEVRRALG